MPMFVFEGTRSAKREPCCIGSDYDNARDRAQLSTVPVSKDAGCMIKCCARFSRETRADENDWLSEISQS